MLTSWCLNNKYSKELEAGHVVITCAGVMVSVFEIGSDEEDCVLEILEKEWFFYFPLDRTQGGANVLEAKFLSGVYLGLRLGTNEMHIATATGVVSVPAIKRKTARAFCLGRVERNCGCTMEDDVRSTARWWRSARSKVSHCSRRWRGTIASATSGAWRTRRCSGPTQSPHPWRCGNL